MTFSGWSPHSAGTRLLGALLAGALLIGAAVASTSAPDTKSVKHTVSWCTEPRER